MKLSRRNFLHAAAASAAGISVAPLAARPAADEKPKGRINQSFTYGTFIRKGVDPAQAIKLAREIGYKSIEMGPREQWDRIRDAGLAMAIFGGHKALGDGLNEPKNHDRIEKELLDSLALAQKYHVPSVIVFSGNRHGLSEAEGLDNCAKGISRVIKAAEQAQVNLAMELLNSKVNHPDYQCDHTKWGVALCKAVNSPRMKLLYDIYHMAIMEGDLIRTITENIQHLAHFHTAGNPGRKDPDETQEVYYPAVMRAIAGTGYTGYVGHEFTPKGDPLAAMRVTFERFNI